MADEIHKDTTVAIIEGSRFDQDGFSDYSQHNTTLSSPDVQKTVNYHTSLRGMKEVPKDDVTTNFRGVVMSRPISRNALSDVTEQVIISDGASTNDPSAKYVATPRQPETLDAGRVWYRDSKGLYRFNLTACIYEEIIVPDEGLFEISGDISMSATRTCSLTIFASKNTTFLTVVIEQFYNELVEELPESVTVDVVLHIAGGDTNEYLSYTEYDFTHPFVVCSTDFTIQITTTADSNVRRQFLRFRFFVSNEPGIYILREVATSPTTGYITTFAFDGQTRYAHDTDAGALLELSSDQRVIMISFPHFHLQKSDACIADFLEIKKNGTRKGLIGYWEKWTKCGLDDIPPLIYDNSIRLIFYSDHTGGGTGFKMFYSIHPASEEPKQALDSGLFNCSVPHYDGFRLHFHCNLAIECVAGEDERDCPYTSTACGQGFIDAGNKCYRHVTVRKEITWYDAYEQCRNFSQRLVSPRTPSEWSTFKTILDFGKKTFGVFVGLTTSPSTMASMYREVWQWADQTMAFYVNVRGRRLSKTMCAYIPPLYTEVLNPIGCSTPIYVNFLLCENDKHVNSTAKHDVIQVFTNPPSFMTVALVTCPDRHVTRDFLSCDVQAHCGASHNMVSCSTPTSVDMAMFACDSGSQTVHYTQVCDHRQDCADHSDEAFCVFSACPERRCKNNQCVSDDEWCDGMQHCSDGSDEECVQFVSRVSPSVPPPAVVSLDGHGGYNIRALHPDDLCPITHFRCSRGYCLPVYLRCNDVYDCPGLEDERDCDKYACPGFYRCRASSVCLHTDHVCDGVFQCPQQDDELLCTIKCPKACYCQGLAFVCNQTFPARSYPDLRYLDASTSGMTLNDLSENGYLVRLSLSACGMMTLPTVTLPNLRWLDLSANALTTVNMQTFASLRNLRVLSLSANPLTSLTNSGADWLQQNLRTVDLSLTKLDTYNEQVLETFPHVQCLNISHGALTTITADGFISTPDLQVLDVRQSPLEVFPRHLLTSLTSLDLVYASNFKLCCPAVIPTNLNPNNCHAPVDEISSCEGLLRSNAYRACLWVMGVMAIIGNVGSFAARVLNKQTTKTGFHVFVTNLTIADFLMGVYLTIIGAADLVYRGKYLWNEQIWKGSVACKTAGFLSLLSSEVSAFFICLITLDRFLVLRFPFSVLHFRTRSAMTASAVLWAVGFVLAVVPLLPVTSVWEFYGQTGICVPLPITRRSFRGQRYSFGVMVVFNFILFLLIVSGQVLIFTTVRKNSITKSNQDNQDATIARRLTTIVLSDFLCWFPIGLLGLLASTGTPISSEVNIGMAIFVLPCNSALNPFLYTFNVFMEKRRKAVEARLLQQLIRKAGTLANGKDQGRRRAMTLYSTQTQTDTSE